MENALSLSISNGTQGQFNFKVGFMAIPWKDCPSSLGTSFFGGRPRRRAINPALSEGALIFFKNFPGMCQVTEYEASLKNIYKGGNFKFVQTGKLLRIIECERLKTNQSQPLPGVLNMELIYTLELLFPKFQFLIKKIIFIFFFNLFTFCNKTWKKIVGMGETFRKIEISVNFHESISPVRKIKTIKKNYGKKYLKNLTFNNQNVEWQHING